jgi:uncharacterized membrane protein
MSIEQLTLLVFLAYSLVETVDEVFFKKAIEWRKVAAGALVGVFVTLYGVPVMDFLGLPLENIYASYTVNFIVATIGAMNGTSFIHDLLAKARG